MSTIQVDGVHSVKVAQALRVSGWGSIPHVHSKFDIMRNNSIIDSRVIDAILERPICFRVGRKNFFIYPATLGKTYVIANIIEKLKVNNLYLTLDIHAEMLRLCAEQRDLVCLLISYYTFDQKKDILNNRKVNSRKKYFFDKLDNEELATILSLIFTLDDFEYIKQRTGIAKEEERRKKIHEIKSSKTYSITVGGASVYGAIIDIACQRYGWTMNYVLWGISRVNLEALLSDSISNIPLTEEESKSMNMPCGDIIDADDPSNRNRIMELLRN